MAHQQRSGILKGGQPHPQRMRAGGMGPSHAQGAAGHNFQRSFPDAKYRPQNFELGSKTTAEASHSDRFDAQLSQNLALILLEKNYESVENQALYSLSALMKDYLLEIGKEIKASTEIQGRTESTLIDTLNVAYEYDMTQNDIQKHIEDNELTMVPNHSHLHKQQEVLQKRANARMDNVFAMKKQLAGDTFQPLEANKGNMAAAGSGFEQALPDYFGRFRTKNTIPACYRDSASLPDRLAVIVDRTPATKVVNQSYERQKKIEQKRATENAIQKVAAIVQSQEEQKQSAFESDPKMAAQGEKEKAEESKDVIGKETQVAEKSAEKVADGDAVVTKEIEVVASTDGNKGTEKQDNDASPSKVGDQTSGNPVDALVVSKEEQKASTVQAANAQTTQQAPKEGQQTESWIFGGATKTSSSKKDDKEKELEDKAVTGGDGEQKAEEKQLQTIQTTRKESMVADVPKRKSHKSIFLL